MEMSFVLGMFIKDQALVLCMLERNGNMVVLFGRSQQPSCSITSSFL